MRSEAKRRIAVRGELLLDVKIIDDSGVRVSIALARHHLEIQPR